jgi:branched-subunit amino acid aminotransferase/4-amino-4-deoxychorismate lyase
MCLCLHSPWAAFVPTTAAGIASGAGICSITRRGLPRVNAKAKDSEWVRQRQALEQQQPRDVNEVILMGPDGALTEGLTSNFFVLSAAGEVVTANEGALNGTVREVVLQVRWCVWLVGEADVQLWILLVFAAGCGVI